MSEGAEMTVDASDPGPVLVGAPKLPEREPAEGGPAGTGVATTVRLAARDFHLHYGSLHALKGISLEIPSGGVTAIIGPSGCGKSTFLRSFNRMNDLIPGVRTQGALAVSGADVTGPGTDVVDLRRRVGMVFQRPNPFPKSIFENVAFGLRMLGLKDRDALAQRVEASLKRAALWGEVKDRLDRSALQLSGGQQQRLCIARALATSPEILLFDEPTSALDPIATARIEELIAELRDQVTVIIVTHNMQQAARVSDQTAFFYQGKLIEVSATDQLYTRPRVKQTEDYITGRFG